MVRGIARILLFLNFVAAAKGVLEKQLNKSGSMIEATVHFTLLQLPGTEACKRWQPHLGHVFPILSH
jgi:hypothetical protein